MRYVGIVGNEALKFTPQTEDAAREIIRMLLADPEAVLVSGGCHLGGVDIYAEEEADKLGRDKVIFTPDVRAWEGYDLMGYKQRNMAIGDLSDVVNVIVVAAYPPSYPDGGRFRHCYHCDSTEHVKSGACWTAKYAQHQGKEAEWWII